MRASRTWLDVGGKRMSEPPDYDILIAYAHEDVEVASALQAALGRQGWIVFLDSERPPPAG